MRDSALKLVAPAAVRLGRALFARRRRAHARQRFETTLAASTAAFNFSMVGEELMRDSALKRLQFLDVHSDLLCRRRAHARQRFETPFRPSGKSGPLCRRRAHARQRFETSSCIAASATICMHVGEELMRDSALKHDDVLTREMVESCRRRAHARQRFETDRHYRIPNGVISRRRAHARQRFETLDGGNGGREASRVGEELMRDSALKPAASNDYRISHSSSRRRAHARQRFETIMAE